MNKKEALQQIEKLKKFIENEDKKSKFATVKFGERKNVLLINKYGDELISTWSLEKDLNDFDFFEEYNKGHIFIFGKKKPFEIIDNKGNVLFKFNDFCSLRFLEELE